MINKWNPSWLIAAFRSLKELAALRARQIVAALQSEPMTSQAVLVRHLVARYSREDIVG